MSLRNLFFGDSYKALFARIIYKQLKSRKSVTYKSVLIESSYPKEINEKLSSCDGYGELKKAFADVIKLIEDRVGPRSIEKAGNNRHRVYKYVGKEEDPLSDMINTKVISDLKKYWLFCQDSAGFFPRSWLEHFFKDCIDLLEIENRKHRGEQIISSSLDRILVNIDLLPKLYENIKGKVVLEIDYKPYEENLQTLIFHPHYIKEYNGRWHILGHAEGRSPEFGYNIAIDRIKSRPREKYKIKYIEPPTMFYEKYFDNIVGVSHLEGMKVEEIIIRSHSPYIHKLTETKPIHHTQVTTKPFAKYDNGDYGEFLLQVELNKEFVGRILQMGDGLEVVSPENVREYIKENVLSLSHRYL